MKLIRTVQGLAIIVQVRQINRIGFSGRSDWQKGGNIQPHYYNNDHMIMIDQCLETEQFYSNIINCPINMIIFQFHTL
jgi:hypothetical protein